MKLPRGAAPLGAGPEQPTLYHPDPDLVDILLTHARRGEVDLHMRVDVTDLRNGEARTVLVGWESGEAGTLVERLLALMSGEARQERLEHFFWIFVRGWAGRLDASAIANLPAVTPDFADKVGQGVPLRDKDLGRLLSALEWAYADEEGEWGSTDSWRDNTISPGHLGLRKKLREYVEERMADLVGPDYASAPVRNG